MRLQVFLSHSGICSRRRAFEYIQAGRVTVNGKISSEPSLDVTAKDSIFLDGEPVFLKEKIYVVLNKPAGFITTTKDRFAEKKIIDILPESLKFLRPAGRLDQDTTGLIILTNDGDMILRLTHPSFEKEKVYRVILDKPLNSEHRNKIESGIFLDGKKTLPASIKQIRTKEVEMVLREGRKRQVRRSFALFGYRVVKLCRIRQGSLVLGDLKEGDWRFLTKKEVEGLKDASQSGLVRR